MPDNPRIEDLRRRIQKDPASIAFAQLAEEYRRAGEYAEAIDVCRAGLALHPSYLSARVTLGRALIELGQDADALQELEIVVKGAPENLAAIRGLAGIHHRRGALVEALAQYRAALNLAHNDPELEETVNGLAHQLTPEIRGGPSDGLSFDQMQEELAVSHVSPSPGDTDPHPRADAMPVAPLADPPIAVPVQYVVAQTAIVPPPVHPPLVHVLPASLPAVQDTAAVANQEEARAIQTLAALEQWLAAIHVARADRHP